ncbi:LEC14B protein, putative isoform 7, partial [Theobroma cacao]
TPKPRNVTNRLEIESELFDGSKVTNEAGSSTRSNKPLHNVDHEIAQLTNLRSGPHERLRQLMPGKQQLPVSPVKMLAGREGNYSGRGRFSSADRCHMLSRYLPVNGPWLVDQMTSRAYVSQFSADGSLFVAGFQGSDIRIYNVDRGWKVQKNILAKSLRWTVTDTSLSPDQRYLVYASMSPIVHIVNVGSATTESLSKITEIHEGLDFSAADDGGYPFGIFSVKFSTDGRELVAGSNDNSIYVYDLEANKLSLRIVAHTGNVGFRSYEWDYRWMDYPPQARDLKHPCDQSVATYKGHSVLRTLIRCYFSPEYSTGQKYIYTGSHDSCVYIYDVVTGAQVAVLKHHTSPVRDCSWHPYYPMLVSSSWDGDVVKWGFSGNGEAPAPMSNMRIRRRYYY